MAGKKALDKLQKESAEKMASKKTKALDRFIGTVKENLSPGKIISDIAKEVDNQIAQGSHEIASVLFRGDAFVMYPRPQHGNDQEQGKIPTLDQMRGNAPEKAMEQEQQERGGLEM